MCDVIGARSAAEEHRKLAGPVFLNPEDMARYDNIHPQPISHHGANC